MKFGEFHAGQKLSLGPKHVSEAEILALLQQGLPNLPRPGVPILKDYKGEEALSSALKSLLVQGTPTVYFLAGNSYDLSWHNVVGAGYGLLQQALHGAGFETRELDLSRGAVTLI